MYFLDSDICIHLMRGNLPHVYEIMRASDPALFGIPSVVEAELRCGAAKSDHPEKNRLLLERFLIPYARIPFDSACSIAYGRIRAELEQSGQKIGPNDLLIAATASAHNATLVTGNIREFSRVAGLQVESWDEVELYGDDHE